MSFPLDVSAYKPLAVDPFTTDRLSPEQLAQLKTNIQVMRNAIIFFTAVAGAKGLGGHTGGAYSIVPEALIADAFMKGAPDRIYPVHFDEGGHRVALQYALAAFNGEMPFEKLLHYREANEGLYGHPEPDAALGIKFASGRLGHLWPFVNGVAKAHPGKAVFLFGSDGSQMEGDDAEAARFAVAHRVNVKVIVDDNDVTISGHPSQYLPGFSVARTLEGHGMPVSTGDGEDIEALFSRMVQAVRQEGPVAVINRRKMAPGVPGIEGTHAGHDVIKKEHAVAYLKERGHGDAVAYLESVPKVSVKASYRGCTAETASNRVEFGKIVNGILSRYSEEERKAAVLVVDSDLEGSTGLKGIRQEYPEVCLNGGVQERGNFSAAAGFGFEPNATPARQGIFSTFSAFLEMIISELTMARLNGARAICHFSHAGIDDMADNTCHYGINIMLADCGIAEGDTTRLYFPADALQLKAVVERIWDDPGIRFVFTLRSTLPFILDPAGNKLYGDGYTFTPGKDEVVREGTAGWVVAYGDMLCRALDAVERAKEAGIDVGLINKPTLNVPDDAMLERAGRSPFVLVVESQNVKTGLGSRYGTWLLERGLAPRYASMGVTRPGHGGLSEHMFHQGIDPDSILAKIRAMAG
ncbi:MAG TPA: transketolase C-terminal domain-containing protein [Candidatus Hydrogenedentes bacterium]|nr:transketolase C-terminal domain-containing protein [Candidatus Hydrogenedentota bacterium]